MAKEEIAANIVIAMMQNNQFKPVAAAEDKHQAFVSAVCDAYKQVYKTMIEAKHND